MSLITLTTDFHDADGFTGVLKGVIAGIAPQTRVVDLAHSVPAGDVVHAAYVLRCSYLYFPPGTVHIVIVDPGVGGARRAVVLQAAGQYFVAPDNGVLTWVLCELESAGEGMRAWSLEDERFHLNPTSSTFHGRDIFAPAGAFLALGVDPAEMGPELCAGLDPEGDLIPGPVYELLTSSDGSKGEGRIIHIDTFGNCITTLEAAELPAEIIRNPNSAIIELKTSDSIAEIRGLSSSYSSVEEGSIVAIEGSSGLVEIAVNGGNAAAVLGVTRGDSVKCLS